VSRTGPTTVSRPGTLLEHGLLTTWVLVRLPQRLEICAGLRDRVALDLIGPLGIDRLNIWRDAQLKIEGQIGHIERPPIETERRACREQQPLRDAVLVDAVEIAELGENLAGLVDRFAT